MFMQHETYPAPLLELVTTANAAAAMIPPLFPLSSSVAVNPFLGQSGETLAVTAARLARVGGTPVTAPRSHYAERFRSGEITRADIAAALDAAATPFASPTVDDVIAALDRPEPAPAALPTVAELAAQASGIDWPALIEERIGHWAASHFDDGQALWQPYRTGGAFIAWREFAARDLTPEIHGLTGFGAFVAATSRSPWRAIGRACETLDMNSTAAETGFHRLLMDLGGWAQYAAYLKWQADLAGEPETTLTDLLAIRLIWDEALLAHYGDAIAADWARTAAAHAEPVTPSADHLIGAALQDAADRAAQRRLAATLPGSAPRARTDRPALQAAFCIDVRSEVFRRALESLDPQIETIGFAGFFGLPTAHRGAASDVVELRGPVLINTAVTTRSEMETEADLTRRFAARAARAWGRFKLAAVSSFAFVEATGPIYVGKLLKDTFGLGHGGAADPKPVFDGAVDLAARTDMAENILRAMSLTSGFAGVVMIAGHGAHVTNNAHSSALQCGACGGHSGEVNARLLAGLLGDGEVRAGLRTRGIDIPDDTIFVAALHDTTSDQITLFDTDAFSGNAALAQVRTWLAEAGALARGERALRLPRASGAAQLVRRGADWAELRPEWGLAGCHAFIAAPRGRTAGTDLAGRSFLHSYDWRADEGFGVLELIMTAPVVVASWISLQYYGSTVAPDTFGGGNKLLHNVTGGIGVVEGNGGALRAGLPWQSVHDGARAMHDPLRLNVVIEAPREAMNDILDRHPGVRALFDNGWLHLFAMDDDGRMAWRYDGDLEWSQLEAAPTAAIAAE
jgi:uncharacterized protein YbcC (UPF0753/DUF2309 family)